MQRDVMQGIARPTRRQFIQRAGAAGALLTPTAALLAACGATGSSGSGQKSSTNPFGVDPTAPLDLVIFKGGYGDQYARDAAKAYGQKYPKAQVSVADVTQQLSQEYQPKFVAGDPPDFMDDSGAGDIAPGTLVSQNQLTDLGTFWNAPSIDDPSKKLKDTVLFETQSDALFNGKYYVNLYALSVYSVWYSSTLFKNKGWPYPTTWDDMLKLCAEIKQAGMAPWTYQGVYPAYVQQLWVPMVTQLAGPDVIKSIDNLQPNAWKNDAVMESLNALYKLATSGYIMPGSSGLTHIESQKAWLQNQAAFIPDGSWVENEMMGFVPSDYNMVVAPTPSISSSDKLPFGSTNYYAGENFIVPAKAKNHAGGLEYMRILLSKKSAQDFTNLTKTLTIVKGAADNLPIAKTDSSLKSQLALINNGKPRIPSALYGGWYAQMNDTINQAFGALMTQRTTPKELVATAQAAADATKSNPNIIKYHR
ncbi:MAG: N-acetylglucosamine/diacetylchitobiose ABC transporter substrate-binding protein [Candidatus Dormiibacterota bacterium]